MPANNNCQFHQQADSIHVLIKGRDIQEEDLDVQFQRRRLTVILKRQIILEGLLQGQVDVGNCHVKHHADFVEIKLKKANPGESWPQLMLGVPDMMTSLQRSQAPASVSPDVSPTRHKDISKNVSIRHLNTSLSNMLHNVVKAAEDEMRDTSLSRASRRG